MPDIGYIISGVNLIVGVFILIMTLVIAHRLKGSILQWCAWLFLVTGLLFATHAWIGVTGLSEDLYALTALIATILLGFTLVIIDITTKVLGVKS